MKTYARIDAGIVVEIIEPVTYGVDIYTTDGTLDEDGNLVQTLVHHADDEVPISERFVAAFVATLVDITDIEPMPQQGWTYDGSTFAPYSPPPLTSDQIVAINTATRNQLLAAAALAMAPLQDAVDLGEATPEETALLTKWKQFRVAVNRVVLTTLNPTWPTPPQPGWGAAKSPTASNA